MSGGDDGGLTIVGGRPNPEGRGPSGISDGLRELLKRLAENPSLAHELVMNPEQTLAAEGLQLAPTEWAMLQHLDLEDLAATRDVPGEAMRGVSREGTRGTPPGTRRGVPGGTRRRGLGGLVRGLMSRAKGPPDPAEEARQRLAKQLELVAPFVGDPDFYMGERTRGIRPQSIYPTPFAVVEALIRSSKDFRAALLQDSEAAILRRPDLPLDDRERQMLLSEGVRKHLQQLARDAGGG